MDANKILNGKFTCKKLPNGSIDETKVICVFCRCELSYHRSTSSLKYPSPLAPCLEATAPVDVGGIAFLIWLPGLPVVFNLLTPVNIYKTISPNNFFRFSNLAHTTNFFIE